MAWSKLLPSGDKVPRELHAKGIKASMPLLVWIFPSLLALRLFILKVWASFTMYCAESAECCILGEYSGLQQVTSMSFSLPWSKWCKTMSPTRSFLPASQPESSFDTLNPAVLQRSKRASRIRSWRWIGPPPDLQVIAWSPKQSTVSPHLHLQSLLKIGIPSQYLSSAENWLSSKYLNERVLGAAESQRAAFSEETLLNLAFSLEFKSGLETCFETVVGT